MRFTKLILALGLLLMHGLCSAQEDELVEGVEGVTTQIQAEINLVRSTKNQAAGIVLGTALQKHGFSGLSQDQKIEVLKKLFEDLQPNYELAGREVDHDFQFNNYIQAFQAQLRNLGSPSEALALSAGMRQSHYDPEKVFIDFSNLSDAQKKAFLQMGTHVVNDYEDNSSAPWIVLFDAHPEEMAQYALQVLKSGDEFLDFLAMNPRSLSGVSATVMHQILERLSQAGFVKDHTSEICGVYTLIQDWLSDEVLHAALLQEEGALISRLLNLSQTEVGRCTVNERQDIEFKVFAEQIRKSLPQTKAIASAPTASSGPRSDVCAFAEFKKQIPAFLNHYSSNGGFSNSFSDSKGCVITLNFENLGAQQTRMTVLLNGPHRHGYQPILLSSKPDTIRAVLQNLDFDMILKSGIKSVPLKM